MSTKIHLAVRGLGLPVRYLLTGGQRHGVTQAAALIAGLPADQVLADTAYDANHFRAEIALASAAAVIPCNPSRTAKLPLDAQLCKDRHLVECCFSKLKHFRRTPPVMRRNVRAMITFAAIILWLR